MSRRVAFFSSGCFGVVETAGGLVGEALDSLSKLRNSLLLDEVFVGTLDLTSTPG